MSCQPTGRLRELSLRLNSWSHDQYLPQGS